MRFDNENSIFSFVLLCFICLFYLLFWLRLPTWLVATTAGIYWLTGKPFLPCSHPLKKQINDMKANANPNINLPGWSRRADFARSATSASSASYHCHGATVGHFLHKARRLSLLQPLDGGSFHLHAGPEKNVMIFFFIADFPPLNFHRWQPVNDFALCEQSGRAVPNGHVVIGYANVFRLRHN